MILNKIHRLHFWCQKVLPLVYDDSLSYYELLCKVVGYLNKHTEYINELVDFFNNFSGDVEDIIREMIESGEMDDAIADAMAYLIALPYDPNETYNIGDYVVNNGELYKANTDTTGDWDANDWDSVNVTDEIKNLKKSTVTHHDVVNDMVTDLSLVDGQYVKTSGYYAINDGGEGYYKIVDGELTADNGSIIALNNGLFAKLIYNTSVNIKQFGAYGDGVHDDTVKIQTAINYALDNYIELIVPSCSAFYRISLPLVVIPVPVPSDTHTDTFLAGKGFRIIGESKIKSRITKIGTSVYTENPISELNNLNATFICYQSQTTTGASFENLTIQNFATEWTKQINGYAIYSKVSRSEFTNLNIDSYYGIKGNPLFSCRFTNLYFNCTENALEIIDGTSNTFDFLICHACKDPYIIKSSYSTVLNTAAEGCTGSIFQVTGLGLTIQNCGVESNQYDYFVKVLSTFASITVTGCMINRQIGSSSLELAECSVFYFTNDCNFTVRDLAINETQAITGNSYLFKASEGGKRISTNVDNIVYYKNHTGNNNSRLKMWNVATEGYTQHKFRSGCVDFTYQVLAGGQIMPHIGTLNGGQGGVVNNNALTTSDEVPNGKAIYMDTEGQYTVHGNVSAQYQIKPQVGDLHLFNDPLSKSGLGFVVTSVNGNITTFKQIPLILAGTTENRPTNRPNGTCYFDTTLKKPIWWDGDSWIWRNASGGQA